MMSLHDSLIVLGISSDTFALPVRHLHQIHFKRIFFGILFVKTRINGFSDIYGWIGTAPDSLQSGVRTFRHFRCCGSNMQFQHYQLVGKMGYYLIPVIESEQIT